MICATCHKEARMLVRAIVKNVVVNLCMNCFKQHQDDAEQAAEREMLEDVLMPPEAGRRG